MYIRWWCQGFCRELTTVDYQPEKPGSTSELTYSGFVEAKILMTFFPCPYNQIYTKSMYVLVRDI